MMAAIAMALLPTPTTFTLPYAPRNAHPIAAYAQFPMAAVRNRGGEAAPTECAGQSERDFAAGDGDEDDEFVWSRRGILGASVAVAAVAGAVSWSCEPAQAFSLGICKVGLTYHGCKTGPKDWLKAQKRKTVQFLLNPIEASRNHLNSAVLLLSSADGSSFDNYEEAGKLVKVAARDCMPAESGSIIEFQSRTGVEVCTFRLVLKNAASLLENDDPVKLEATAALDNLIRSFIAVDGMLAKGGASAANQKEDIMGALNEAMVALNSFEQEVQNCLNVA